ncbi:MAG: dihydropteroate synthase [Actinobacteria bacterium]|nr:dihydropteroate synthase [Actinomycetota bacterium]
MFDWKQVRGRVMGVVNVTPDSFSDGGRYLEPEAAAAHGLELAAQGAAVLDVGGESTRPGAAPVDAAEETRRVVPVVRELAERTAVPISVDTTKAEVAAAALEAGAAIVNDVSAGRLDPAVLSVVADAGAGYVVMHMLGEPRTMQDDPCYGDVVREVGDFLCTRLAAARGAGIAPESLMADPGIGFGKTVDHNLALLAHLGELVARVRVPVLVGTSRKRFLGALTGVDDATARDDATLPTVVWSLERGAAMVRVHDVGRAVHAATVLDALRAAEPRAVGAVA